MALVIPIYSNFDNASASDPLVGVPGPSDVFSGETHGVFAPKYDQYGVWIENSWGTSWGDNGWGELSWAFVDQYAEEGWTASSAESPVHTTFSDDFSSDQVGSPPAGWILRGSGAMTPTVQAVGGQGSAYNQFEFPYVGNEYWDKWALVANTAVQAPFTVTVKMNFQSSVADRAGITIGWKDDTWDRIDIQPNVYWDDIEFRTSSGIGSNYTVTGSAISNGGLTINPNTNYWLRVQTSIDSSGNGVVNVYWSTDGTNFTNVLTASGPSLGGNAMLGQVGIGTAGPNMPLVDFDDFSLTS